MVSVMTDCPHRERLGWLEQYHVNGPSLRYKFDLASLFTKGMNALSPGRAACVASPGFALLGVLFPLFLDQEAYGGMVGRQVEMEYP